MLLITLAFQESSHAQQTQPSTQPALDYYSGPNDRSIFEIETVKLKFTISPDADIVKAENDFSSLLSNLAWVVNPSELYHIRIVVDPARVVSNTDQRFIVAQCHLDPDTGYEEFFRPQYLQSMNAMTGNEQMQQFHKLAAAKGEELAVETVRRLKQLVTSDQSMSARERKQRLAEVDSSLTSLSRKMAVLAGLSKAQPNAVVRVAEKLKNFREREQELQMKLSAAEARRMALEKGLADLRQQAELQRRSDPKIDYYRAGLDLKKHVYERKAQAPPGTFNQDEIAEAEADVKQAQAALAVAEAEAAKGGRGELMDRLANELTMVSIDTTDLQIQLKQLHDLMSKYDPAVLDAANLDALLKGEPGFGGAESEKLPPLYYELQKQFNDLRREQLILMVDNVSIVTETQQQP